MKAIILAGGLGKRLRPLTTERPKSLIEVAGIPILGWQLDWLRKNGVTDIVLCIGYMKDDVIAYIGDGEKLRLKVSYAVEGQPLGTGGAIKNAKRTMMGERFFLVINGDIISNINPMELTGRLRGELVGVIALVQLRSPFGIIETSRGSYVTEFKEKPLLEDYWINAGVYYLSQGIFDYLPDKGNIETETFPKLARRNLMKAVKFKRSIWRSIDSHKDIEEAGKELKFMKPPEEFRL